jgi:redox-sensitive bicupin YhaK (pirin superfamily)
MHVRRGEERGQADFGWLKSAHTFSFGGYHDPRHMGFGVLRVINDDRVAPRGGFPTHPHRDMEIISYVVEGELAHRDTLGNGSVIRPGEVQRMSAGTGIAHSEENPSADKPVRFLQIWIEPAARGRAPGYEQRAFEVDPGSPIRLVVSPDGAEGSLALGQDARIYRVLFAGAGEARHELPPKRAGYLQVVRGSLTLNGQALVEGDGAALPEGGALTLTASGAAEALLFDLPEVRRA